VLLYWGIGRDILSRQESEGWGAKIIDRLAADLGRAFPEMTGLSARNLKYMRAFAEAWPDLEFVQPAMTNFSRTLLQGRCLPGNLKSPGKFSRILTRRWN
jgi:hypothetical protein